eukprot:TRINITY_DN8646_c0_g1_i1.p1 TRINITY_DN8646_c0_g1~~TRINITY_DN8646_c0_g1_i1.p1  ORF type:complete len:275 (+),score=50.19 TRINITY_DN8646_c0_g1_i1:73-825(+)
METKQTRPPLSSTNSDTVPADGGEKKRNRVSFKTIKFTNSRERLIRSDSNTAMNTEEAVSHETITPSEGSVEATQPSRDGSDYLILKHDKQKPQDSKACNARVSNDEVLFIEDIFVPGDTNDEAVVLELETYEWVPLSAHFTTAEDKDIQHMNQPSKTTDASEITLSSTVVPPKVFFDKKKNNYFVLDGVHRTFYLRKAGATHVLALVSSLYDLSLLNDREFWTKNYVVDNWEQLKSTLNKHVAAAMKSN